MKAKLRFEHCTGQSWIATKWKGEALASLLLLWLIASDARAGVVAHWSFDQIVNTNQFEDLAGTRDATIASLTHVTLDATNQKFGAAAANFAGGDTPTSSQAVEDTGIGAFARVPYIGEITQSSFTVAGWVQLNPDSWFQAVLGDWSDNGGGTSYMFGTNGPSGSIPRNSSIHVVNNVNGLNTGQTVQGGAAGGNFEAGRTTPMNDGQWYHLAWVFERSPGGDSATITKYIDGAVATHHTGVPAVTTWAPSDNNVSLRNPNDVTPGSRPEVWIGLKEDNGADFNGKMDELWVFDHALSQGELRSLMNNNIIPEPSAIILLVLGGAATWVFGLGRQRT